MKFKDANVHDPRTPRTIYDWSQTYRRMVKLFELCDEGLYAFLETHGKLAVMKGSREEEGHQPSFFKFWGEKVLEIARTHRAPTNQSSSWLDPFSSIREKKEEVRGISPENPGTRDT